MSTRLFAFSETDGYKEAIYAEVIKGEPISGCEAKEEFCGIRFCIERIPSSNSGIILMAGEVITIHLSTEEDFHMVEDSRNTHRALIRVSSLDRRHWAYP